MSTPHFQDPLRFHVESVLAERADEPLTPQQVAHEAVARYRRECIDPIDPNLLRYATDRSVVELARRLLKGRVLLDGFGERVPQRLWIDGRYKPLIGKNGRLRLSAEELEAWAQRGLRLAAHDRRAAQQALRLAEWMRSAGQQAVGP